MLYRKGLQSNQLAETNIVGCRWHMLGRVFQKKIDPWIFGGPTPISKAFMEKEFWEFFGVFGMKFRGRSNRLKLWGMDPMLEFWKWPLHLRKYLSGAVLADMYWKKISCSLIWDGFWIRFLELLDFWGLIVYKFQYFSIEFFL